MNEKTIKKLSDKTLNKQKNKYYAYYLKIQAEQKLRKYNQE